MIFLYKWVIFRLRLLIFQGGSGEHGKTKRPIGKKQKLKGMSFGDVFSWKGVTSFG